MKITKARQVRFSRGYSDGKIGTSLTPVRIAALSIPQLFTNIGSAFGVSQVEASFDLFKVKTDSKDLEDGIL